MPCRATQCTKCAKHFAVREIRVPAAWIRQHEHPGTFEQQALHPELHGNARFQLEKISKDRDADKRDDRRLVPLHFPSQNLRPGNVFAGPQRVDPRRRAGHQVRDAEPPLRQPVVVFRANQLGDNAGFVEEFPEAIGIAREVMVDRVRAHARIDAHEQDSDAVFDTILQHELAV